MVFGLQSRRRRGKLILTCPAMRPPPEAATLTPANPPARITTNPIHPRRGVRPPVPNVGLRVSSMRWSLALACGLAAAAVAGCQNAEEIRHYQVPREPRVRMLAAIVPHGDKTWFVKVAGPEDAVEAHKGAFNRF